LKTSLLILLLWVNFFTAIPTCYSQGLQRTKFDFYGDAIDLPLDQATFVDFADTLSEQTIQAFYDKVTDSHFEQVVDALVSYRQQYKLDDWLYYQLIRKTAQSISPKASNYQRYTLYKWFFLCKSGYDAIVTIKSNRILFYVQSDEIIYNIPYRIKNGKQYVCLNYHDYGYIDFTNNSFSEVRISVPEATNAFSYKVTRLPNFNAQDYREKDIQFTYNENEYHFKVKVNPQVKTIFANYPVVDYGTYFNIPLSAATYGSLIPSLKEKIKRLGVKEGVDYLMHFTRYAFLFKPDEEVFGQEKRLSPEQTLLYDNSDCEDRAGLFFYLVKEIYDLPMIVVEYPKHVTIAVKFDKPYGNTITYNGIKYSICEPSSQREDLRIGETLPSLRHTSFDVPYAYTPKNK
jgi:hypothetical protein